MKKLTITHLYPKHMSLYGDRGNVQVLSFIAKQLGYFVEVANCSVGERIANTSESSSQIIMLGGGQDSDQEVVLKDLLARREELKESISAGAIFLGVCGGYQLLGEYYESAVGNYLDGLKLVNLFTRNADSLPPNSVKTGKSNNDLPGNQRNTPAQKRIIGNVIAESEKFGMLTGFENHGGRTFLSEGATPLASVLQGGGNNGQDKTEGVFQIFENGLIIGTYLHSFLARNPKVAEFMVCEALGLESNFEKRNCPFEDMNKQVSMNLRY